MVGSIADNAAIYKKSFVYVPPTPPAELIDSTTYTLNFASRKFIHIGNDPTTNFNVSINLITSSRYVQLTPDFLRQIYSLMGYISPFILEQPQKYKRNLFFETEQIKLSSMVYSGENVLVIESKTRDGCRVLLNHVDLLQMQYLECCIFKTIVRKSSIIRPIVLKQFEIIGNYLDREFTNVKSSPTNVNEMKTFIKNLREEQIILSTPKESMNFISQLKINATSQLAEQWSERWSNEDNSSEVNL